MKRASGSNSGPLGVQVWAKLTLGFMLLFPSIDGPPVLQHLLRHSAQAEAFSFVLRVSDPSGLLGGKPPKVSLNGEGIEQLVEPLDNGERPDVQSGDGVYSCGVASWSTKALSITVFTDEGGKKVFGQTQYTFDSTSEHNLSLVISDAGLTAGAQDPGPAVAPLEGSGPAPVGEAPGGNPVPGGGALPTASGPEPGPVTRPTAVDSLLEPLADLPWRPFAVLVGGGALGILLFRSIRGRRGAAVMRIGLGSQVRPLGPDFPGVAQSPVLWRAPEEKTEPLLRTLLWTLLNDCDVLLVPSPAHRARWMHEFEPTLRGIWMMERDCPSPSQVLETAHELESLGRPVCVVIEGLDALSGSTKKQPAKALSTLLARGGVPCMAVLALSAESPTHATTACSLELNADGLLCAGEISFKEENGRLARVTPPSHADAGPH